MRIKLLAVCLLCACFLCACGTDPLERENIEIARSYRSLYRAAEKGDAMTVHLEQEAIDAIVDSLSEDGLVSASTLPTAGIRLAGQVERFCDGELDSLKLFVVCPDGGFIRYDLVSSGMCTVSRVYWDGSKPVQSYAEDFTAPDFTLTDGGVFHVPGPGRAGISAPQCSGRVAYAALRGVC